MEYQYPITAISRGGESRIFYDADALWAFIRDRSIGKVGAYWTEARGFCLSEKRPLTKVPDGADHRFWHGLTRNEWILRDNAGRPVDKEQIPAPPVIYRSTSRWARSTRYCDKAKRHAAELGLPIPGTGMCRRYKHSRQGAWSKKGKNGAHNQRKGIKLYEDPIIRRGDIDDL